MLKKRLIFTLLIQDGIFQLSRNFSLQAVGDIDWLYKHYHFESIAYYIDELVLVNVGRSNKKSAHFAEQVVNLSKKCFMPIAAGGGIRSLDDAYTILGAGADKLIVNTPLFNDPALIEKMAMTFGGQCVVASIDYKRNALGTAVYYENGSRSSDMTVMDAVLRSEQLGVGEIYLTSMDKDGTGQGYDFEMLTSIAAMSKVPIIASGGVGDFKHFVEGMRIPNVTGVSTANIFNFIGEGLTEARRHILEAGIPLAQWDFDTLQENG